MRFEHGLIDRILGCGTLHIESAGERGQVVLPDVPHVEHVHLQMSDLLFGGPDWRPGGQHQDPRDRFKVPRDVKRKRFAQKVRSGHGPKRAGVRPGAPPRNRGPKRPR